MLDVAGDECEIARNGDAGDAQVGLVQPFMTPPSARSVPSILAYLRVRSKPDAGLGLAGSLDRAGRGGGVELVSVVENRRLGRAGGACVVMRRNGVQERGRDEKVAA